MLFRSPRPSASPTPRPSPAPTGTPSKNAASCDHDKPTCEACCPYDCEVKAVSKNGVFDFSGQAGCVCAAGAGDYSTVTLTSGDDCAFVSGNYAKVFGGAGDDVVTLFDGKYGEIQGGEGDDVLLSYSEGIKHLGGSTIVFAKVEGGAGDDAISVKGNYFQLRGGDGDDEIVVDKAPLATKAATHNFIWGGPGKDGVVLNNVFDNHVWLADGGDADTTPNALEVHNGNDLTLTGGGGADTVVLDKVSYSYVSAGAGA